MCGLKQRKICAIRPLNAIQRSGSTNVSFLLSRGSTVVVSDSVQNKKRATLNSHESCMTCATSDLRDKVVLLQPLNVPANNEAL